MGYSLRILTCVEGNESNIVPFFPIVAPILANEIGSFWAFVLYARSGLKQLSIQLDDSKLS